MPVEIRFAIRNLLRNPVRSGLAFIAILFGVIAVLLSGGFIEWIFWAMREATVHSRLGHIQVVKSESWSHDHNLPGPSLLAESSGEFNSIASIPGVRLVTPRLGFSGLIGRGETTLSFIGEGVDPRKEEEVSSYVFIIKGRNLDPDDPEGIILGEGLATNLAAGVGSRITLIASTASGSINGLEAHVRGIFYTLSKQFDDAALRAPMGLARRLMRTSGSDTWIILLNSTDKTENVLRVLRTSFSTASTGLVFTPGMIYQIFTTRLSLCIPGR